MCYYIYKQKTDFLCVSIFFFFGQLDQTFPDFMAKL